VPEALAPPVERPLARQLWSRVLDTQLRRFQLILGPRRVGKTTVMYQTVRRLLDNGVPASRLWWLRLDHPLLLRHDLDGLVRTIVDQSRAGDESPVVLFLDEVVNAADWDLWLKTFYDERWPVAIVATSSAMAALRDRRSESGVGRWEEQYLTPYLFTEYLDLDEIRPEVDVAPTLAGTIEGLAPDAGQLHGLRVPPTVEPSVWVDYLRQRFLFTGGFPELLIRERNYEDLGESLLESQRVLRDDAIERAIYRDIPQSFGVDDPAMLERLLYVLAGQVTGILSPANICGHLDGMSQPTFDRYLSYLERAFLVFTLPNFSGREATVQKRGRKLYFVDGAIRNAALQRGLAPLDDPVEMGALLENLVAATLQSLALQQNGVRLFHWRDRKHEVDLVLDHPEHPMAFEVGSSPDHDRGGLLRLTERHSRFEGRCYVVAPRAPLLLPDATSTGVGSIPLDLFLISCGRQTEAALVKRLDGASSLDEFHA
jgi:predicted AAA+ superfamily ATPase